MPAFGRLAASALICLLCLETPLSAAEALPRPRQAVIISFDGSHEIEQWRRSRALAARTGAHFTYFLSCVYLLSPQTKGTYRPPDRIAGKSNVGFALSKAEVVDRLHEIWAAHGEGHEIASHACGHFDGAKWTADEWMKEFASFHAILRDAWTINGIPGEPDGWSALAEDVSGFRAPYLSTGRALYAALKSAGFAYDASAVSRDPEAPSKQSGVVRFALPLIPEGPAQRRVIAMDYNMFVRNSGGFERLDEGGVFEDQALAAFDAAFLRQYEGDRRPLQIALHFTLMNGGAYWRALERFATDVCARPDVDCISYADYLKRRPDAGLARADGIDG